MFSRQITLNEESLAIIRQFGEHMPGGFFLYKADENEELLYANKAVCDIFGCSSLEEFKEMTGFTFRGMIHPEDCERVSNEIRHQIANAEDEVDHVEYRIVRKDGEIRWIDDYGHYVESDVYRGLYYVFISDITDQRLKAESDKALRTAVIEALTRVYDSVWMIHSLETQRFELLRIDKELVHTMPASEAMRITQFSDAFAFYSRLVLEEDRPGFLEAVTPENIDRNTQNRLIYSVPFRRVFETGIRYYRLEFARLVLKTGEVRIVAGFKDVDEEVRKEQQIQQALREAIDAANASNRAKSDFLSSMSHDIRTPINGIIGMTTIAMSNLDNRERVADCLRKIADSSDHLLSLINEVLDMNKIESGKIELLEEEFSLRDLIASMLAMTRPQIQARGHAFRLDMDGIRHERVIGDNRRIQQVFVNILSNAIKYTPDGGSISLTVRETPTKTHDFGHYQFIFEDNGFGMTEEFQKHLFEPFARANDRQNAGIQGTGLGMTITRNLVRMMGGDIGVDSVYGKGSRFTVNLYLKIADAGDSGGCTVKESADAPLHSLEEMSLAGKRVLLAEDQDLNAEIATDFLEMTGLEVDWARDGDQVVEKMAAAPDGYYSMIFMDIQMPNRNGYQAAQAIRAMDREWCRQIPIVAMTADAFTDDVLNSRRAGMNEHIAKPIDIDALARILSTYVKETESGAQDE